MHPYTWDITWISKINIFLHGISSSYSFKLSDKYFQMSHPMDMSVTNIFVRDILGISSFHSTGPCGLGSLAAPSDPGCHGLRCGSLHHLSLILWISHSQIFVSGISLGYLHTLGIYLVHLFFEVLHIFLRFGTDWYTRYIFFKFGYDKDMTRIWQNDQRYEIGVRMTGIW